MAPMVRYFLAVLWLSLPPVAQAQPLAELSSYKLGAGDLITIRVVGEEDLKREKVRLSDAGTISFPSLASCA